MLLYTDFKMYTTPVTTSVIHVQGGSERSELPPCNYYYHKTMVSYNILIESISPIVNLSVLDTVLLSMRNTFVEFTLDLHV